MVFVYCILSISVFGLLRVIFCSALAKKNNKSVTRIYTSLLLIICFICEIPLRCKTNDTLTNTENVDLGLLREVFLKLIFSCSAP